MIWISISTSKSSATKLGQALERLTRELGLYGDGVVLRFLPGDYETHGIRIRPRWHVVGAGIDKTRIKLVPSPLHLKIKFAYHSVIGGGWGSQYSTGAERARLAKRTPTASSLAAAEAHCGSSGCKKRAANGWQPTPSSPATRYRQAPCSVKLPLGQARFLTENRRHGNGG